MNPKRRSVLKMVGATGVAGTLAFGVRGSGTDREERTERKDGSKPPIEPIFSYPTLTGGPDDVHEETVRELLAQAVPGTDVYFSTFTLTRTNVGEAFLDAAERGVSVNVLIDEHFAEADATQSLLEELPDSVSIVVDGAIGVRNSHNKFLLVEQLANGNEGVVWQSSSNFTNTQRHRHNTSVIFREDPALYDVYRSYWQDMATGETDRHYNRTEETDSATVFFSPRSDFDTHLEALRNVSPTPDATIRFVYSIWRTGRLAVVDRIAELVDRGCTVEVIVDEDASNVGPHLRKAGATVFEYPHFGSRVGLDLTRAPNVHSKNMLVDAEFDTGDGETERRKLVYTGSQNLSENGLVNNDETFLRIEDEDVYCQFVRDWDRIRELGRYVSKRRVTDILDAARGRDRGTGGC